MTFEVAWNICHNDYKGYLTNIHGSNRSEELLDNIASNDIWHGTYFIPLNWISYEGKRTTHKLFSQQHQNNTVAQYSISVDIYFKELV